MNIIPDVKSSFQQEMLEIASGIEYFVDTSLIVDLLKVLVKHFEDDYEDLQNP